MNDQPTTETMNLKRKQTNRKILISLAVGLLLVISVAVVGYSMYSKDKEIDNLQNQINALESVKETAALPEERKVYENNDKGLSFNYPQDWKIKDVSSDSLGFGLEVMSPDFVELESQSYDGTAKGGMIRVRHILSTYTQQSTKPVEADGDGEIDSILNKTDTLSEHMSEVSKELEINGRRGVAYGMSYEGPPSFTTTIDTKEGYYVVQYTDVPYANGSTNIKAAKYYKEYNALVNSFKVTE